MRPALSTRIAPDFTRENACLSRGLGPIAGVDEAGRGPLAGPVVAAAVILDPECLPLGCADSKILSAARRTRLAGAIREIARVGTGIATVEEIDRINILRASHLAMLRAIDDLARSGPLPQVALIDGNMVPAGLTCEGRPIVKGDALCLSIAAASIIAKTVRDEIMVDLAQQHPGYGWEKNAGYPTPGHKAALRNLGVSPHHRRSFRPVHNILCREKSISD